MEIVRLKTNHLVEPLGFWMEKAVVSYSVRGCGEKDQERVQVALDPAFRAVIYDSGLRDDIEETGFTLPIDLTEMTRYYWKIYVQSKSGEEAWSERTWFETTKTVGSPWQGDFITTTESQEQNPIFVKALFCPSKPTMARLYLVALGVYELYLNDKKVGDECLLPGIHDYDSWIQYQSYDLPMKKNLNVIEVRVGSGWYKGEYGLSKDWKDPSKEYAVMAELHVTYEDGTTKIFGTDRTWQAKKNPVFFDGIYPGEKYDANIRSLERPIKLARQNAALKARLFPRLSPKITIHETITPKVLTTPKGETVLDMGQNMVGWLSFKANFPKGTTIHLSFGEILQEGCFYRDNLRSAKAEFTYVSNGKPETVRQHYTFYGFRYVKVEGFPTPLKASDFKGLVIHSDMEETFAFKSSDKLLNRLVANVRWGMKGNFLDTATDCPQRDERMGWTGDAQIFSDTALFLMDATAFYTKYLHDLALEQQKHGGAVTYVVPSPRYPYWGSSVWGEAATVIPWNSYVHSGDKEILHRQWDSMKAWVDYMLARSPQGLWDSGHHFGDWLALDGETKGGVFGATDVSLIATASMYLSTNILRKTARVLQRSEDEAYYERQCDMIKHAYQREYFTPSGKLAVATETAYALSVALDLIPEGMQERTSNDFRSLMKQHHKQLTTGFVGTPFLCSALEKSGNLDIATGLLFNKAYPGWFYEVLLGATTIWERWNSVEADGKISGTSMNSLNHYAYGSILSWVIRTLVGLRPSEEQPGGKLMTISPHPVSNLHSIDGTLTTPYGDYHVAWALRGHHVKLSITVPFDGKARLVLPNAESITEAKEITWAEDHTALLESGSYTIEYTLDSTWEAPHSMEEPISTLSPAAKRIIQRYLPSLGEKDQETSLEELLRSPFVMLDKQDTESLIADMEKLDGR